MIDACVIFDVDGVLLELTAAEEEAFFVPFTKRFDASKLSRDWNSYKIRNDENIIAEILVRYGLPANENEIVKAEYLEVLRARLLSGQIETTAIPGARDLIRKLNGKVRLGMATANFRAAAQMRLETLGLWQPVSGLAFGADGGGHKSEILGRALSKLTIPKTRVVYIGDNLNDVKAGLQHGVHFIGFSTSPTRLSKLTSAGAELTANNHLVTYHQICDFLQIDKK